MASATWWRRTTLTQRSSSATCSTSCRRTARLPPPSGRCRPPGDAPDSFVPAEPRKVYDVRDVARSLLDGAVCSRYRRASRATSCARSVASKAVVGIVANQPRYLVVCLTATPHRRRRASCGPATSSVSRCSSSSILRASSGHQAREARCDPHGAKLCMPSRSAPSARHDPDAQGVRGAFIAMNSKELGADFVYAWPSAQLGVMGAMQAVDIIHRETSPPRGSGGIARFACG